MERTCLKCGHQHQFNDALPSDACPQCGAIYAKVEAARRLADSPPAQAPVNPAAASSRLDVWHWTLLATCVLLAISTALLGSLLFQELRLNRVLLSQREVKPAEPIRNPPAAIAAASLDERPPAPMSSSRPPASLAEGAEVMVVSGYEAEGKARQGTAVQVSIDRPGKSVLLVLASYERIVWQVSASEATQVRAILVSGYDHPRVETPLTAPVYQTKLPYSYEKDSGTFVALLKGLKSLFGVEKVDAFRGQYSLPERVVIDQPDPPQSDLTLQGEQPQAPLKSMEFQLSDKTFAKVPWSLGGPVGTAPPAPLASPGAILVPGDGRIYRIASHAFEIVEPATGKVTPLELPDNFPRLSWPTDVTYDSKRHLVVLASLGGEGYLYRYAVDEGRWQDFRSLDNIDINALAYDEQADRFAAWTSEGGLLFLAGDGTPLNTRRLADRLPGYNRLYDTGNSRPPRLQVVPQGDRIALLRTSGDSVQMIWYYDVPMDLVQLTYKKDAAAGAQP